MGGIFFGDPETRDQLIGYGCFVVLGQGRLGAIFSIFLVCDCVMDRSDPVRVSHVRLGEGCALV